MTYFPTVRGVYTLCAPITTPNGFGLKVGQIVICISLLTNLPEKSVQGKFRYMDEEGKFTDEVVIIPNHYLQPVAEEIAIDVFKEFTAQCTQKP